MEHALHSARDGWTRDNNLGLRWASEGRWFEAADAFARAVELSASDFHNEPTPFGTVDLDQEESHAVLLANLSHALFQTGRIEAALESAEQACAMRVALLGDDAMAVARSRNQVAVMLGFLNRFDEAHAMMGRALTVAEQQIADDGIELAPFLENAARLALAAGDVSTAEPYLLRLHALLVERGHSAAAAEELLELIAHSRARAIPSLPADTAVVAPTDDAPILETAGSNAAGVDVANDVFVETRASDESVNILDSIALPLESTEPFAVGDLDVLDLRLELNEAKQIAPAVVHTAPESPRVRAATDDIFGGASFDLVEPPPPTLNVLPPKVPVTASRANPLGFEVEYGVPQQPYEPTDLALPGADVNSAGQDAIGAQEDHDAAASQNAAARDDEELELTPDTRGGITEMRVSPLDQPTPLVMPGHNAAARDSDGSGNQDSTALRLTLHPADIDDPLSQIRRSRRSSTGSRLGRTKAADPKRPWLIAAAIILVGLAGALLYTGILARH